MPIFTIELTKPDFTFTATDSTSQQFSIDIPVDQGGNGNGVRPMQTVLAALGGCSGVDIVSILKKQRETFTSLKIEVDGERETGKEPALWKSAHVRYLLTGDVHPDKVYRAALLSIEKYCSVAETLRRAGAEITWDIYVNGEEVKQAI